MDAVAVSKGVGSRCNRAQPVPDTSLAEIEFSFKTEQTEPQGDRPVTPSERPIEALKAILDVVEPPAKTSVWSVRGAFSGFWSAIKSVGLSIGRTYTNPTPLEKNGTIYRYLGVHHFKRALLNSVGRLVFKPSENEGLRRSRHNLPHQGSNYNLRQHEGGLRDFLSKATMNETIHLVALIPCFSQLVSAATTGMSTGRLLYYVGLGALNLYCIMLQRYNRARIHRVLNKIEQAKLKSAP